MSRKLPKNPTVGKEYTIEVENKGGQKRLVTFEARKKSGFGKWRIVGNEPADGSKRSKGAKVEKRRDENGEFEGKLERAENGTFENFEGGEEDYTHHGKVTHIGKEFARQHGKEAEVGDIVRTKTKDGTYHERAPYYIKTRHGWRKSPTGKEKPDEQTIERVNENSREGRNTKHRRRN